MTEKERLFSPEDGEFQSRTDSEGRTRVDLKITDFPGQLWLSWEKDCKEKYNDMRWLKMYCDHLVAIEKTKDRDAIYAEVMQLIEIESQKATKKEDEDEPKTFRS